MKKLYRSLNISPPESWGSKVKILGSGSFGEVFLTDQNYAVKEYLPLGSILLPDPYNIREVIYLAAIVSDHVMPIQAVWIEGNRFWIQMPVGSNGLEALIKEAQPAQLKRCLFEACLGVWELHRRGIVHLDLKLENFMMESGKLKILDLGLSRNQIGVDGLVPAGNAFSLPYMPPEEFLGLPLNFSSDIWSLGVIFLEVLSKGKFSPFLPIRSRGRCWGSNESVAQTLFHKMGKPTTETWPAAVSAFEELKPARVLDNKPLSEELNKYPNLIQELIQSMLTLNPQKRPSIFEVLNHPWFGDLRHNEIPVTTLGGKKYLLQYQEPLPEKIPSMELLEWFYLHRKLLDYPSHDLALQLVSRWPEKWDNLNFRTACMVVGALVYNHTVEKSSQWAKMTKCDEPQLRSEVDWIFKQTQFHLNVSTPYTFLQLRLTSSRCSRFEREALVLFRAAQNSGLIYRISGEIVAEVLFAIAREFKTGALANRLVSSETLKKVYPILKKYLKETKHAQEVFRSSPTLQDFLSDHP